VQLQASGSGYIGLYVVVAGAYFFVHDAEFGQRYVCGKLADVEAVGVDGG